MTTSYINAPLLPVALLVASASLAACGGTAGETAKAPSFHLLDEGDRIVATWPDGVPRKPPQALRPLAVGTIPPGGRLARVTMSDTAGGAAEQRWFYDDRPALLAPGGTRYRVSLVLPADPYLQVGLGHAGDPEAPPSRARFEVTVEAVSGTAVSGVGETVLDEVLDIGPEGRWQDREIPLERWAGKEVTVELRTRTVGDGPLAWAAWSAPVILSGRGRDDGWDVLLISLDTLRPDHLGCYGYERPTSPAIDALAARGVRFATAISQSPWTRPSHRALFTGLHPLADHDLAAPPLATLLRQAGYRTLAMTSGGQLHPRFGFAAGFDVYQVTDWVRDVGAVVDSWERARGRRQFLFLHTYEVHDPYFHKTFAEGLPRGRLGERFSKKNRAPQLVEGEPTPDELAYVHALYDGGIAFTDEALGRLFAELEARGAFERTIVVLTSDHGEQFWEHGNWGHGGRVFDHQLRVPLIVYLPPALRRELGGEARLVERQVRLVDLYPTLLDLLGLPLRHTVRGRSLRPLLAGGTLPEADAFAEHTNVNVEAKALRTERLKLIYSYNKKRRAAGERLALYDLGRDPGEQRNLAEEQPELTAEMFERLQKILRGAPSEEPDDEVIDDAKLREQLRALGYIDN